MLHFLKKIWFNIKLLWYYLIQAIIGADRIISSGQKENISPNSGIEQQQEQQSVLKDLLRGEVTEEVKELRHEMYYSERKSHEYVYNGGGHAKKNTMFDYSGSIENSDGNPLKLVLVNKQIVKGLNDEGIHIFGKEFAVDETLTGNFKIASSTGDEKYSFEIERNFYPRFKLEKYTQKLVVKDTQKEGKAILDLYVSQYKKQFDNISQMFQSELDRIYQGDKRSEILQFDKLSFTTMNCYGVPDLYRFEYGNPIFEDIIKYDGCYVLRFYCDILVNGEDTLNDIYHEATNEKNKNHEMRKGATVDFETMKIIQASEEETLFDEIKKGNC